MNTALIYGVCGVLAYLLGGIPSGLLIARAKGVDIRTVGSGNIGATNVFRALGPGWGILAFACDALKGFVPVSVFPFLAKTLWSFDGGVVLPLVCACLAIAGHNWPVYLRFKGGKGVATSVGALTGLAPVAAGVGLLTWVLVFVAKRYVSLASIWAAAIIPFGQLLRGRSLFEVMLGACVAVLILTRHRPNMQRLFSGTEHRAWSKRRESA